MLSISLSKARSRHSIAQRQDSCGASPAAQASCVNLGQRPARGADSLIRSIRECLTAGRLPRSACSAMPTAISRRCVRRSANVWCDLMVSSDIHAGAKLCPREPRGFRVLCRRLYERSDLTDILAASGFTFEAQSYSLRGRLTTATCVVAQPPRRSASCSDSRLSAGIGDLERQHATSAGRWMVSGKQPQNQERTKVPCTIPYALA
jgi:hypothetical protein